MNPFPTLTEAFWWMESHVSGPCSVLFRLKGEECRLSSGILPERTYVGHTCTQVQMRSELPQTLCPVR